MEKQKTTEELIAALAKTEVYLWKNGGACAYPNEFESLLNYRSAVLGRFGLPAFSAYLGLISFMRQPTRKTIARIVAQLHGAAQNYFNEPVLSRAQYLEQALRCSARIDDVLAELGMVPHTYTVFVCAQILKGKKDSAANVLLAFDKVRDREVLNAIGVISYVSKGSDDYLEARRLLDTVDVPYLAQYLTYLRRQRAKKVLIKKMQDENSFEVPF